MERGVGVGMRVTRSVERAAAAEGFDLTAEQREVLAVLAETAADLTSTRDARGVYVWGSAGRGKSWLLDAFFRALPVRKKTRVHFHGFLEALQRRIHAHRPAPDAVRRAVADLTGGARVIYFDEFQVHDSGDAILLTRLLDHLSQTNTVLLATSNHPPGELMAESPWRHVAEDAIRTIESRMRVVRMAGDHDLRTDIHSPSARAVRSSAVSAKASRGSAFTRGVWLVAPDRAAWAAEGLRVPPWDARARLVVNGRDFEALAARPGELWISFEQLCVVPMSPIEYLEWVSRFRHWSVLDLPSFAALGAEAQQRFVTVIDILSDAGTRLAISSELTPAEFRADAGSRPEAFRMLSRLHMLRTVPAADARLAP